MSTEQAREWAFRFCGFGAAELAVVTPELVERINKCILLEIVIAEQRGYERALRERGEDDGR